MAETIKTARHLAPYAQQVDHACQWSGLSRTRLEGLLRDGSVRAVRVGRRTLILTESLRGYIDSLPSAR